MLASFTSLRNITISINRKFKINQIHLSFHLNLRTQIFHYSTYKGKEIFKTIKIHLNKVTNRN